MCLDYQLRIRAMSISTDAVELLSLTTQATLFLWFAAGTKARTRYTELI